MPIAPIEILAGRTAADRQKLIAQVTAAIVTSMGVNAAFVRIVLTEAASENWGVGRVPKLPL